MSLRTLFWLAGCGFLVAASASFLVFLRLDLPWWTLSVALGTLVGAVVLALEAACAAPIERLSRISGRTRDGVPLLPAPMSRFVPVEIDRIWKGLRAVQDQAMQARRAEDASDAQRAAWHDQVRMLARASWALKPGAPLAEMLPSLLADLASHLGVDEMVLVPLDKDVPLGVLAAHRRPEWANAVRGSSLAPWQALFAQDAPAIVSLTDLAPEWRSHWGRQALWVVPLSHHGSPMGLLLTQGAGAERTWTPEEWTLLQALAPMLAAALHLSGPGARRVWRVVGARGQ